MDRLLKDRIQMSKPNFENFVRSSLEHINNLDKAISTGYLEKIPEIIDKLKPYYNRIGHSFDEVLNEIAEGAKLGQRHRLNSAYEVYTQKHSHLHKLVLYELQS